MAGESPDKAEQQGSSDTAAAPGGGGRDPRLSVLRESEPSPASTPTPAPAPSEPSDAPARVDQPTAVFKNLVPRTSGEDDPKGHGEPEGDGEPKGAAESEPDAKPASEPEPESERLKAAVAAWVATEAEEPGKAAEEPAEAEEAPEAATTAGAADEPEADGEPVGGVADADESDGAGEEAAEPAEPVKADASVEDDEAVEDAAAKAPEAVEESEESSESEGKATVDSWFAARKPSAGAKPEPEEAPEPAEDAKGPKEPTGSKAPSAAEGTEATAAVEAVEAVEGAKGTEDAKSAEGTEDAKSAKSAEDAEDAEGTDVDDPSEDQKPVDQPTAMFKMIRPPVDQPTTALKLPAGPAGAGARVDPDSERTSTFLPLRPDIPAERKAPEAETAGTTGPAEAAGTAAPALAEPERTRQQPLPPLPPLDLLAELTNTPPPPPSPLRTTLRRVRIWTPLVLLLLIVFAIAQMVRPLPAPALKLSAAPTFVFEGGALKMPWPGEGQGAVEVEGVGSMGTYGPQKPAPIASVTKTMTAYVILRDHPLKGKQTGPEIKIDKKAADQGKAEHESTAAVEEGQTYSQKELLQLLMIPSANNVARLLARWDAGSEAAFVEKMNAAAKDLGMDGSTYTDPSGLLDSTVSTPQDQLKLAKAVMQYDVFREIVNMPNVTVEGIPGRIENNNNILLKPGVGGIKTGSSTPAGGNLLWSANTVVDGQNRRILGIVMGAKNAKYLGDKLQLSIDYSYELIKRAQKDVTSAPVVRRGQVLGYVDDGLGGRTPVVATKELKAVGWPGLEVRLELTDGGKALPHSGKAGDVVGQVSIGTGTGKVSSPVALQDDLAEPGFDKKLTRVG